MKAIPLDGAPAARADYGIDAPGVIRILVIVSVLAAAVALTIARLRWLSWMSAFCVVEAVWMLWASRVGKLTQRDLMLDALQLRGHERVVDVGCGRGLLLIGAAHRLTTGRAIGVDLWSQTDLSSNSMQATLDNARIEGVSDRVEVHTGDARSLPLPDASVDVVVSSLAIHNIPDNAGRAQAIREAIRVLKPGGAITVQDIRHAQLYATTLRAGKMQDVRVSGPQLRIFPFSRIVTARKPV